MEHTRAIGYCRGNFIQKQIFPLLVSSGPHPGICSPDKGQQKPTRKPTHSSQKSNFVDTWDQFGSNIWRWWLHSHCALLLSNTTRPFQAVHRAKIMSTGVLFIFRCSQNVLLFDTLFRLVLLHQTTYVLLIPLNLLFQHSQCPAVQHWGLPDCQGGPLSLAAEAVLHWLPLHPTPPASWKKGSDRNNLAKECVVKGH